MVCPRPFNCIFHCFSTPLDSRHIGFSFLWLPKALACLRILPLGILLPLMPAPVSSSLTPFCINWSQATPLNTLPVGPVWLQFSLTHPLCNPHICLDTYSIFAIPAPHWNFTSQSSYNTCDTGLCLEAKLCQNVLKMCGVTYSICTISVTCQ